MAGLSARMSGALLADAVGKTHCMRGSHEPAALLRRPPHGPPPGAVGLLALGVVAVLVATGGPARAHAEHEPLPEGFQARIAQVVDAGGQPAALPVRFTMTADGARVSVSYDGAKELIIFGEQAAEPLIRMAAGAVMVNAASPQARQVDGADVDPAAAAQLIDLVWDRVPPAWEPVARGGTVSFRDHRAVPGHPPARTDFVQGDIARTWSIPFSLGGLQYSVTGDVVAVGVSGSGSDRLGAAAGVLLALLVVLLGVRGRRMVGQRRQHEGPDDPATTKELVRAR